MKKKLRWILILGALLFVLMGIGLVVALNSSVQTKVALHILQKTDPQAKLGSVSFGFGSGEIHGLELTTGGLLIKLDSAKLQYSLSNLIFGATKTIDSAQASGLVVDLTAPKPKTTSMPPATATGEKKPLPAVLIKKADVSGTVMLATDRSIELSLSAQNFGAGGDGKATGTLIYRDKSSNAKVNEMRASTQASVALDAAMLPKNVDCTVDLSATLPGQTQPSQLSAHLQAKPVNAKSGEITLALAPPTGSPLVEFKGTYTGDGAVTGDFNADLTRAQIEPFALGYKLPDFDLRGQGQLAADSTAKSSSVKATFAGTAGHLEILRPELAGMGNLAITANLDLAGSQSTTAEKTFSISGKTLTFTLAPQGGQPAITLELLKPVTAEYGAQGLKLPAGTGENILKLTLAQAPAAWLAAVLPKDFSATGQGLNGQITLGARDDGALTANTTQPITFAGLDVKQAQESILAGGVLEMDGSAQYLKQSLQAQVRNVSFQAHSVAAKEMTLASRSASGKAVQARFTGNVSVITGGSFPQILATGQSSLILDIDQLDPKALGKNLPALAPAGLLTLDANLDVATTASSSDAKDLSLNVNALKITLTKGTGAAQTTFVTINALQKFSLPIGADAKLQPISGNLASLQITNFPLTVVQAFLPPNLKFSGSPVQGNILLVGEPGAQPTIALHTIQPFTIENAQFSQDNIDKLAGVTLTLSPEGTWKNGEIKGDAHLLASATAGTLLDATLTASQANDTLTATVAANGQLSAIAAQPLGADWRNLLPASKPQFTASASLARSAKSVVIQNAAASVVPADGAGAALAEIKLSQPVTLLADPADAKKYLWPKANGDVLSVKLSSLPVGVLSLALPGFRLQGQEISVDILVHGAGDGNYTLTSNGPISATGLSVTRLAANTPPAPWIRDLTFTFKPSATFSNAGLSNGSVQDLRFSSANTPLVVGNVDFLATPGQMWPQQAKISLRADLAQLLNQPILAKYNNLAAGTFQMDGTLAPDGSVQFSANLSNWSVRNSQTQLPQMLFQNATGKINRSTNEIQFSTPIKGQGQEGPTDCVLAANYGPSGNSHKFALSLTGNSLVIDDLLAIKQGLFPPAPATSPVTSSAAPTSAKPVVATAAMETPDKAPIWGDNLGTAKIQLKALRFHAFAVDNFQVDAQVSPAQAVLSGVTGQFQGAPLSLNATLAFDAKQASLPYQLQTGMSFKSFDVGAFFKSRDAQATPPVEGNFSITGNAAGRGANIDDVIDKVQFDFKLGSDSGTFHLLDLVPNKTLSATLKALSKVSGVASSVLSLIGQKNPASAKTAIINSTLDLMANLDSIQYTKLSFIAQRAADLNVKLTEFDLQSKEIELAGTGQVTYQHGVAIPDQPLAATLSMNAKGGMAQGLQGIHSLGKALPSGYSQGPQFNVGGTMQHPDYKFLNNLITQGATALGL